jgi:hypothetical protein
MVRITNRAAAVLAEALRAGEAGKELGFRLVPSGPGEILLAIDTAREGDQVIRHDQQTVLLLDVWLATALDGAVLDVDVKEEGASLTLYGGRRPQSAWN